MIEPMWWLVAAKNIWERRVADPLQMIKGIAMGKMTPYGILI